MKNWADPAACLNMIFYQRLYEQKGKKKGYSDDIEKGGSTLFIPSLPIQKRQNQRGTQYKILDCRSTSPDHRLWF